MGAPRPVHKGRVHLLAYLGAIVESGPEVSTRAQRDLIPRTRKCTP